MKRLLTYHIFESFKLKDNWFNAILTGDIKRIERLIKSGVDINMKDKDEWTALITSSVMRDKAYKDIIKLLLEQPEINITIAHNIDDFVESLQFNKIDRTFLNDYKMQKKIIENGREDIIKFLNNWNLINPKIKQKYPHLFSGMDLNLI